jgi:hypothetical protein
LNLRRALNLRKKEEEKREKRCRLLNEKTLRSCRFAYIAFSVYKYMFGRVLNREFMNPRVRYKRVRCKRDLLYETLFNSLNRSEGFQRTLYKIESLIVRVNDYRSILNAYDAGRETETERPRLFLTL